MKLVFDADKAITLIITSEKLMYGVVMLRIDQIDERLSVSFLAVADGGEVCGQKQETFSGKNICSIITNIADIDFPEDEDDEECLRWGLQIGDEDGKLISGIEQGYWDGEIIMGIVDNLDQEVGACEALEFLRGLIEF